MSSFIVAKLNQFKQEKKVLFSNNSTPVYGFMTTDLKFLLFPAMVAPFNTPPAGRQYMTKQNNGALTS